MLGSAPALGEEEELRRINEGIAEELQADKKERKSFPRAAADRAAAERRNETLLGIEREYRRSKCRPSVIVSSKMLLMPKTNRWIV
ncbi:MAG: hypothetical protein U1E36_02375 [Rickettsiales bacterium]